MAGDATCGSGCWTDWVSVSTPRLIHPSSLHETRIAHMTRYGPQLGPDITFLGVPRCDLDDPQTYADADVVILGAPFDGGISNRPGARFGPMAIRMTDYLPHDGSRPSLALRTDGLVDLTVVDAGDVEMYSGDIEFGSLWGHGQPMRRLIELTEIGRRGLQECLTEAFVIAMDECDGVFLSVDIDVCDPGHAPGTGTPEPGGLTARELLDSVRRICLELPVVGVDIVEVSPPFDHADITAALANRVVLEALSAIARRRQDARDGTVWDPTQPLLEGR